MTQKTPIFLKEVVILTMIIFIIWLVDFFSTILAYSKHLVEANKIWLSFFNLGLIGWIITPFLVFAILMVGSLIIMSIQRWVSKITKKKENKKWSYIIPAIDIVVFYFAEILTIIYNIRLIIGGH